jgi:acetyl-CoA C-acetyltransferase
VPGMQIDRRCGSGLQAVIDAVLLVQTGAAEVVIAGGVESMSNAPFYATTLRRGVPGEAMRFEDSLARGRVTAGGVHHPVPGGMVEATENVRAEYGISRTEQDELALRSHQRAVAAQRDGHFTDEIIPVTVGTGARATVCDVDEHPRADTSLQALAALRPLRLAIDPGATVTAGNASGQNDGAAVCIVTTATRASAVGLMPIARLISWAVAGVPPNMMGLGPVPAVRKALQRAGLEFADLDLIELNEAFAAQVLACTKVWNLGRTDLDRLNVNGSGISLGHPVGATGGRILATLLHELRRRDARYGLETMCIGGGQGLAAVFEAV